MILNKLHFKRKVYTVIKFLLLLPFENIFSFSHLFSLRFLFLPHFVYLNKSSSFRLSQAPSSIPCIHECMCCCSNSKSCTNSLKRNSTTRLIHGNVVDDEDKNRFGISLACASLLCLYLSSISIRVCRPFIVFFAIMIIIITVYPSIYLFVQNEMQMPIYTAVKSQTDCNDTCPKMTNLHCIIACLSPIYV